MTRLPHTHEADGLECLFSLEGSFPSLSEVQAMAEQHALRLEYKADKCARKPNPVNQTNEE